MTPVEEQIIAIEQAIAIGKKIPGKLAWYYMEDATEHGKQLRMIWKIPSEYYEKWYQNWKEQLKKEGLEPPTTIDEETTYIVYSGEKAFDSSKGGYSIFAKSLGCMKRGNSPYEIDRIENYMPEWAIIY